MSQINNCSWYNDNAYNHWIPIDIVNECCLGNDSMPSIWCYPSLDIELTQFAGFLAACNAIIGFTGNMLTLLAIPYATKRKK